MKTLSWLLTHLYIPSDMLFTWSPTMTSLATSLTVTSALILSSCLQRCKRWKLRGSKQIVHCTAWFVANSENQISSSQQIMNNNFKSDIKFLANLEFCRRTSPITFPLVGSRLSWRRPTAFKGLIRSYTFDNLRLSLCWQFFQGASTLQKIWTDMEVALP